MQSLHGKLALVTGAASGIGRALALELARFGVELLLVDINDAELAETVRQASTHGGRVAWDVVDLASRDETARLIARVGDEFTQLDILVNNAGVAYYGTTHEMTEAQWQRLLSVNLLAPLQLTRALLPGLLLRPEAHVLNVSSVAGLVGVNRLAAYNATKFALVGFSESLRAEYSARGLGVTTLCPGLVRTKIFDTAMTSSGRRVPRFPRWLTNSPEGVARRAVQAIRKNRGLVVVGMPARVIWWIKRLLPAFFDRVQGVRRVRPASATVMPASADHTAEATQRAA